MPVEPPLIWGGGALWALIDGLCGTLHPTTTNPPVRGLYAANSLVGVVCSEILDWQRLAHFHNTLGA